jgi:hypothetical protein
MKTCKTNDATNWEENEKELAVAPTTEDQKLVRAVLETAMNAQLDGEPYDFRCPEALQAFDRLMEKVRLV